MPNSSKGTAIIAITVAKQFYLLFVYNYNHHILFYNLYTLSLIAGVKMNKVLSEDILKKSMVWIILMFDIYHWQIYQNDDYSCGVFVCLYSYCASLMINEDLSKDEWCDVFCSITMIYMLSV